MNIENQPIEAQARKRRIKTEWQRNNRKSFREANGFSTTTHYRFSGIRKRVLERDGHKCAECGMSDIEHRQKWNRPLNVHHKDGDEKNNAMDNLQTLCYSCHGKKHIAPHLIISKVPEHKERILSLRSQGRSCNSIAKEVGFDCKAITKWLRRWNGGVL